MKWLVIVFLITSQIFAHAGSKGAKPSKTVAETPLSVSELIGRENKELRDWLDKVKAAIINLEKTQVKLRLTLQTSIGELNYVQNQLTQAGEYIEGVEAQLTTQIAATKTAEDNLTIQKASTKSAEETAAKYRKLSDHRGNLLGWLGAGLLCIVCLKLTSILPPPYGFLLPVAAIPAGYWLARLLL